MIDAWMYCCGSVWQTIDYPETGTGNAIVFVSFIRDMANMSYVSRLSMITVLVCSWAFILHECRKMVSLHSSSPLPVRCRPVHMACLHPSVQVWRNPSCRDQWAKPPCTTASIGSRIFWPTKSTVNYFQNGFVDKTSKVTARVSVLVSVGSKESVIAVDLLEQSFVVVSSPDVRDPHCRPRGSAGRE